VVEWLRGQAAAKLVRLRAMTAEVGFTRFKQHDFEDPAILHYEVGRSSSRDCQAGIVRQNASRSSSSASMIADR
jgi:hypothetical protein